MKTLFSLLFLSLFFSPVLSLECYACSPSTTNEECNQRNQTCQAPLDTCMTVVDTLGIAKTIVKHCASRATCTGAAASASVDANGNGNTVNCCRSHSFCNFSGANIVHIHIALLALALCASIALLTSQ
ncbi:uncharacterized protein ACN63O_002454 [Diretmus argenteus]